MNNDDNDNGFNDQMGRDLTTIFFNNKEFAEVIVIDQDKEISVIFDRDVEVINEEGTLDRVSTAITLPSADALKRNAVFVQKVNDKRWTVGRLLEKSIDGRLKTLEVTPSAIA